MYLQTRKEITDNLNNIIDEKIVFIFDFDSTMVNTDSCYRKSWQDQLNKKGIKLTEGFMQMTKNSDDDEIYNRIREYYAEEYSTEEKEQRILNLMDDINKREPYQYVIDLLNTLSERACRIMLVTDNKRRIINSYLEKWNLKDSFNDIHALSGIDKSKENIYRSILMTNKPKSVLVFDDRQDYIDTANKFYFDTIGIEPYNNHNLKEDTCKFIVRV